MRDVMRTTLQTMAATAAFLVLSGCSTAASTTVDEPAPQAGELEPTIPNIKRLIGTPKADSIDACKLLSVGRKACGGPQFYMVYSTESVTDEAALMDLVQRYNAAQQEINRSGQMSNCQFIPRPQVTLQDNICGKK